MGLGEERWESDDRGTTCEEVVRVNGGSFVKFFFYIYILFYFLYFFLLLVYFMEYFFFVGLWT